MMSDSRDVTRWSRRRLLAAGAAAATVGLSGALPLPALAQVARRFDLHFFPLQRRIHVPGG
jgi:hypothetical protein